MEEANPFLGSRSRQDGDRAQEYIPVADGNDKEPDESGLIHDQWVKDVQNFKRLKFVLRFFICLSVVSLAALLFLLFTKKKTLTTERLLLSPVPQMPLQTVMFEEDPKYALRPSLETDQAWNGLLPDGRGFVFIHDPEQYNLPPGQHTAWDPIYSISMFHQVHCLGMLRKYYWILIDGVMANDTKVYQKAEKLAKSEHVNHCFDYIRQGIMCAGDMSIEWPRVEPDGRRFAVDGWGIPHECKSWDAISDYMQKYHFNASVNHEIAPHRI